MSSTVLMVMFTITLALVCNALELTNIRILSKWVKSQSRKKQDQYLKPKYHNKFSKILHFFQEHDKSFFEGSEIVWQRE